MNGLAPVWWFLYSTALKASSVCKVHPCSLNTTLFLDESTFGDAPLTTVIGVMILNALQISSCWCVTDQCLNMNSVGLLFMNHPIVCEMFTLHQIVIKIFFKRIRFLVPTKESYHKWLKVVKLRQYWPELDCCFWRVGHHQYSCWGLLSHDHVWKTLPDLVNDKSPFLTHNKCIAHHILVQNYNLVFFIFK